MHIFTLILGLVCFQTEQTSDVIDSILREGKSNSQVMDHLDQLVNGIGPRLTSSDNDRKSCEWARDKFKSFGIENARLVFKQFWTKIYLLHKMTIFKELSAELQALKVSTIAYHTNSH